MNTTVISSQTASAKPATIGRLRHKGIDMLYDIDDAYVMQQIVNTIQQERQRLKLRSDFQKHFDLWWNETCMYSGANFYIRNSHYKALVKLGKSILPLIEEKMASEPEYKHGLLELLRATLTNDVDSGKPHDLYTCFKGSWGEDTTVEDYCKELREGIS